MLITAGSAFRAWDPSLSPPAVPVATGAAAPSRAETGSSSQPAKRPLHVRALTAAEIERVVEETVGLAETLRAAGEFGVAAREYERVLELSPSHERARLASRLCAEMERRFAPIRTAFAVEDFDTALRLLYRVPEDMEPELIRQAKANGWFNRGIAALYAGRRQQAFEDFSEAVDLTPHDLEVASARVRSLGWVGGGDSARFRERGPNFPRFRSPLERAGRSASSFPAEDIRNP